MITNDRAAQILKCYERDRANPRQAYKPSDVPDSFDAFTPEWLTHAVCDGYPGAYVTDFKMIPVGDGSTNRRRILLEYNDAGYAAGLPQSVFCKSSHELASRMNLGLTGAAHGEMIFYRNVRPLLNIEAPRAYHANYDPESFASNIILEDLTGRIRGFGEHDTPVSRQRAESMVLLIAEYHGTAQSLFAERPKLFDFPAFTSFWQTIIDMVDMEQSSNRGFKAAEEQIPSRIFARFEDVWPTTLRAVAMHENLPQTVLHNDPHLRNWYIRSETEMGLMDWQLCSLGSWSRDFAYAVSCALEIEDRRHWERDLLRLYIEECRVHGGDRLDEETCWTLYRQQLFPALAFWTNTLSPSEMQPADMQPAEAARTFIRRMAAAIDDLDAFDAF